MMRSSFGDNYIMKKLPIGVQSIREILEEKQVYVDKTGFALDLISKGKHYFMSRPRRFGKSLFLNTLEEIFKGNKEIFKECKIYESDYSWQKHPVREVVGELNLFVLLLNLDGLVATSYDQVKLCEGLIESAQTLYEELVFEWQKTLRDSPGLGKLLLQHRTGQ